jgi:hypothetical protein
MRLRPVQHQFGTHPSAQHNRRPAGISAKWLATLGLLPSLAGCVEPPLVHDLPGNIPTASAEYDHRVRQRFPDGSEARGIVEELRRQGFRPRYGDSPSLRVYDFTKSDVPCELEWIVTWTPGADGRIAGVGGTYGAICP